MKTGPQNAENCKGTAKTRLEWLLLLVPVAQALYQGAETLTWPCDMGPMSKVETMLPKKNQVSILIVTAKAVVLVMTQESGVCQTSRYT